jgi:hypothetical protein
VAAREELAIGEWEQVAMILADLETDLAFVVGGRR